MARGLTVQSLAAVGAVTRRSSHDGWIRFPFYHHVFDDERTGFEAQLRYLRRSGEFIDTDDAVSLMRSGSSIHGRFFCLGFDDGFKNCVTNALPILAANDIPCTFFVATAHVGSAIEDSPRAAEQIFGPSRRHARPVELLSWDDCRQLVDAGMVIGSHTHSHARLSRLDADGVWREMQTSKALIEREVRRPCLHFCSPWGKPFADYLPGRDPWIARRVGFLSFHTGIRGATRAGASPFEIRRDHLLAGWGIPELRYFLAL